MSDRPHWYGRVRKHFGWPKWCKLSKSKQAHWRQVDKLVFEPVTKEFDELVHLLESGTLNETAYDEALNSICILGWVLGLEEHKQFSPTGYVKHIQNIPDEARIKTADEYVKIIAAHQAEIEQLRDAIDGEGGWREQVNKLQSEAELKKSAKENSQDCVNTLRTPGELSLERMTDRARKVLMLADSEAKRLNHVVVNTGHLLLGLLREVNGVGATVLQDFRLDIQSLREEVCKRSPPHSDVPMGKLPLNKYAKSALEAAVEEAKKLGHNYVGTEHILLGLVSRQYDSVSILKEFNVSPDDIRKAVQGLLQPTAVSDDILKQRDREWRDEIFPDAGDDTELGKFTLTPEGAGSVLDSERRIYQSQIQQYAILQNQLEEYRKLDALVDWQEVGKLLGLKVGDSVREELVPRLRELVQRKAA